MRSTLRHFIDRFFFHPRTALLVAFTDGELEANQAQKIQAHLDHCLSCCARVDDMRDGLTFFARASTATRDLPLDTTIDRIAASIREHSQNVFRPQSYQIAYARLQSELTIYLGSRAASQLLKRFDHALLNRERLKDAVEPVVKTLLGERAGLDVLANLLRILDHAQGHLAS